MSTRSVLSRIINLLNQAEIPSMVAGSFASTYHGIPRSTNDIDIVIAPTRQTLTAFLDRLPEPDYYVSQDAAFDALRRQSQFNVIDLESGWKVDLIICKSRPFSIEEFRRRLPAELFEVPVFVATAEDTILAKLEWSKLGESERQVRDVAGIVSVKAADLDREYVAAWARELGVTELWQQLISAKP
jgi:hypothetical protein